ncbi:hypothetical protein SBRCBS47491_006574 [Sporothrix bragantina]|uniref:Major facilitator superfamily (MFS) profile domain-containing protein n=1 Tax=Sporothrix bragantina TaxID=671064 RepID=A0ABP0C8H3_9PEZI
MSPPRDDGINPATTIPSQTHDLEKKDNGIFVTESTDIEPSPSISATATAEQIEQQEQREKDVEAVGEGEGQPPVVVEPQGQTNLLPMKQLLVVFAGLSTAMLCSNLNQTIVATALPTLGAAFHDAGISSWVGTAYLLTSTACQPLYGRLSDIFGRKVILVGCLLLFLLGAILSGVSQNMAMLIVSRAIAGIGGGGIITVVNIVVSDVVSLKERGKYQGIIGVVVAVGTAVGPLLGGVFVAKTTWRWCFYISIPFSVVAIVIVAFGLPLRKVQGDAKEKLKKIDVWGCLVSFVASIAILIPISWAGTQYSWSSPAVLVPLLLGVALIGLFTFVEMKVAKLPLIPPAMFKNTHVSVCVFTSFLTGFMTFVNLYYLPQFYQVARGESALNSGILILPLILSQIVTSFTSGFLVSIWSCYRINLIVGYGLWTIASGLFTTVTPTTATWKLVVFQLLTGLGSGQTLQVTLVAIQAAVTRADMAVITGARNYFRMLGSTIAIAASAAIVNNIVRSQLTRLGFSPATLTEILSDPTTIQTMNLSPLQETQALNAYAKGVSVTYYMMTALAGLQFILCCVFVKDYSLERSDDAKQREEAKAWLKQRKEEKKHGRRNPSQTSNGQDGHTSDATSVERKETQEV